MTPSEKMQNYQSQPAFEQSQDQEKSYGNQSLKNEHVDNYVPICNISLKEFEE